MNIIGQQKSSFIDYPNNICTVYFTGGCNFKCPYCHNKDMVDNKGTKITEEDIFNFLNKRRKFIDAVCISGGEPTLQKNLYSFISRLKKEGFLVKLDTNGYRPDVLKSLIDDGMLDYIAMDIKGPLEVYDKITGINNIDLSLIEESIRLIRNSNVEYEFRTTVCKELLTKDDIVKVGNMLKGSKKYFIQNFKDGENVLCGKDKLTAFSTDELLEIEKIIGEWFETFNIRK